MDEVRPTESLAMSKTKNLQDQIASATDRLAKLKARELLAEQRQKAKAKAEARRDDAHRKIKLGGLVVAAGAGDIDAAELVGALLGYEAAARRDPARRDQCRANGRAHLAAREHERTSRKG